MNIVLIDASGCQQTLTMPGGVTEIKRDWLFKQLNGKINSVVSVVVPEGVVSIGEQAFSYFRKLILVTLPGSLRHIKNEAFMCCHSLACFHIPDGVVEIGDSSLQFCVALKSLLIPASMKVIGVQALANCARLISVFFDRKPGRVWDDAFKECTSLQYIFSADGPLGVNLRDAGVPAKTQLLPYMLYPPPELKRMQL
jgi:hypothetical protein